MTRVDFYTEATDKTAVACRLAAKAMQQALRVLIVAPEANLLKRVDQMLWTTPPTGFVPHCYVHDAVAAQTPVLLAASADSAPHDQVLINLGDEVQNAFTRFDRLLEIVSHGEDDKARARERYRFYKDRGNTIQTHKLGAALT